VHIVYRQVFTGVVVNLANFLYIEVIIEHFLQNWCVHVGDSGFRYHGGVLEVFYVRALIVVLLYFGNFFAKCFV